ncbi:hypothetical protein EZV77_20015 [Burkholderia thailandensis]|nr:hypothetical protein A8H31_04290 [Burkholderia thailandensis]AVR29582.1 hypothetical protein A8H32_28125 [Burkholderia thailandensis]AWY62698.1 hypothetical protein A8H35_27225 [Burkholderia thailandensis]AWY66230.1 hypothetical protein A8H36_12385 [Burkholderia thailandensis]MDD1479661.1 hypothetical protein [Burkholderia thailandensis]
MARIIARLANVIKRAFFRRIAKRRETGAPGNPVEIARLPYNSGSFRPFRSISWQSSPPNRASNTKT